MNVNNFFIGLMLFSFNLAGQEKEVFFLLEKENSPYVFFINGQKESVQNADEAEEFFITSTKNFSSYINKNKDVLIGEPNLPRTYVQSAKEKGY